jgi:hypothetical protein
MSNNYLILGATACAKAQALSASAEWLGLLAESGNQLTNEFNRNNAKRNELIELATLAGHDLDAEFLCVR